MLIHLRNNNRAVRASLLASILALTPPSVAQSGKIVNSRIDNTARVTISHSVHRLAKPESTIGTVSDSLPLNRLVLVLASSAERQQALAAFLEAQHNKNSPSFQKWLTPEEFADRFGASQEDIATVVQWLQQEGFAVNSTAKSRRWIEFSGTAGQVQRTFQTFMRRYLVRGEEHIANATDISIPVALAPMVQGLLSLNDFAHKALISRRYRVARNSEGTLVPVDPQFTNPDGSSTTHYLAPADLAKIYNIAPLYEASLDGSGQTIAIAGRTNIQAGDIYMFRQIFGLPYNDPLVVVNGPDPVHLVTDDALESSLDVEWAGAIAPQATIKFVASASTVTTDGIDLSAAYIVDKNLADIVTLSYGACEQDLGAAGNAFYKALWEQAAAQGMTVFVSSGDNGFAGCDPADADLASRGAGVNGLASTPFNIAVGGTQFQADGSDPVFWSSTNGSDFGSAIGYIPETVWNESCSAPNPPTSCSGLWAGSGGASTIYPKPSWQSGAGVPSDGKRDLPDISLTAAGGHDGYLVCFVGSCVADNFGSPGTVLKSASVVGGTSASAPVMAGIFALINQKMGGGRQGAANWNLYYIANSSPERVCDSSSLTDPSLPSACSFYDITSGNNNVPGVQGVAASPGYDLATGLGSVNAANLAEAWATTMLRASAVAFTLDKATAQHGSPIQASISVSPASGSGTPTGSVVLISDKHGPFATVSLTNGSFSGTISTFPGGQFDVSAHYSGDDTFRASDSSPIVMEISHEPSTTSLSPYTYANGPIVVTKVPYGNFVYFHATVAGRSGVPASGGTVVFQEGQAQLGAIELTSKGEGEFVSGGFPDFGAVVCLPLGTHTITAFFEGDDGLDPSTSSPVTMEVTKASPSVFFGNLTPVTWPEHAPLPVAVYIKGSGPILPTGTVQFYSNGTPAGEPSEVFQPGAGQSHQARATLSLPAGTYSISANYSGDSVYLPSDTSTPFGPLSVTVQPSSGTPSVTALSIPSTVATGSGANFTVTVTSQSGTPTGTVALSEPNSGVLAAATLVGGVAKGSIPPSWLSIPGIYTIAATYSGDSTFAASASVAATINVPRSTPSIALTATKNLLNIGERFNLLTNLSNLSFSSVPGEFVQYYDSFNGAAAQPVGAPRILTLGPTRVLSMIDSYSVVLPQGTHTLTVQFLENWMYNSVTSAPVTVEVAVVPDITIAQTSALLPIIAGQIGSAAFSLTPHGGLQGVVTLSCITPAAGISCSFTPASVTLNGSTASATVSVSTTAPSNSTTALVAPHEPANPWWSFGSGLLAACAVFTVRRQRRLAATALSVFVSAVILISCGGGGGSSPPPPPAGGGSSVFPSSTALSVSSLKAPQGNNLTLSATVSSSGTPSGTVTFFAGTDQIGSPVTVSDGVAKLQTSALQVGTHSISARYSGDAAHMASTSGIVRTAVTGSTQLQVQIMAGAVQRTAVIPLILQ